MVGWIDGWMDELLTKCYLVVSNLSLIKVRSARHCLVSAKVLR